MNQALRNEIAFVTIGDKVRIRPRGKRGIYCAEFWHSGQHCRRSLKTANFEIARRRAVELEHALAAGQGHPLDPTPRKPITLAQAKDEYLGAKRAEAKKSRTITKYTDWLKSFTEFAERKGIRTLQQVDAQLFEAYQLARKSTHKPRTMRTGLMIVKQWFKWCSGGGREYLAKNPLAFCKISPVYEAPKFTPTPQQVDAILAAATGDRKAQYAIAAFAGLRAEEVQMLSVRSIDLEGNWIHVLGREGWIPKTHQARKIPIHPRLRNVLEGISRAVRPYFFCAPASLKYPNGGHRVSMKRANDDLQKLVRTLGFPVGRKDNGIVLHSLRHYFETQCVDSGVPQFVVDVWMGHVGQRAMGRTYYGLTDVKSQDYMKQVRF
jgi:integrase